MGCFSACFGSCYIRCSKAKRPSGTEALDQKTEPIVQDQIGDSLKLDAETERMNEEQLNGSGRKKVTFDLNGKIQEEDFEIQSQECANLLTETDEGKGNERERSKNEFRAFLNLSETEEEKTEEEEGANEVKILCEKEKHEQEKANGKQGKDEAAIMVSDSSQSSLFTYPPNNRYKNCATSDDECEDTAMNRSNLADEVVSNIKEKDGHGGLVIQEESSESLFSLSLESKKQPEEIGEKEVSSPFKPCDRDRKACIGSVLDPIENLSQWKAATAKAASSFKNQEKENVHNSEDIKRVSDGKENLGLKNEFILPFSEEHTLKQSKRISKCPRNDVIGVDTSLSSWLMESENSPNKENSAGSVGNLSSKKMKSPKSFEDRPILGVLTLDELKQISRNSSPRRSPSFSPDDTPIIGTVGSYWRHTGQAADSSSSCKQTSRKSSTCKRGKMRSHSTPFETRLEEVIDNVAAEV